MSDHSALGTRHSSFLRAFLVTLIAGALLILPAQAQITPGFTTLPVSRGGTGATTLTSTAVLKGNGTGAITASGVLIDASNNLTVPGTGTHTFGTTNTVTMAAGVVTATSRVLVGAGETLGMQVGNATPITPASTVRAVFISPGNVAGGPTIAVTGGNGGYGAGVDFISAQSDATTTFTSMAKVVADGTSAWNSTASTQDAKLTVYTAADGVLGVAATFGSDKSLAVAGSLTVTGVTIIATSTPASAAASGVAGTIAWDASYIYVCTATNTWKRVAIATW